MPSVNRPLQLEMLLNNSYITTLHEHSSKGKFAPNKQRQKRWLRLKIMDVCLIISNECTAMSIFFVIFCAYKSISQNQKITNYRNRLTISCVSSCYLSEVPVVISFHLKVEYFGFCIAGFWNQIFIQETLRGEI